MISLQYILSMTCFIVSIGQGAPAIMPVRSDDRSNMSNIGWFSSAMNIVGTPCSAVQRSLWTDASTFSGSKSSTITMVDPCVMTEQTPSTHPKQWNNGTQISSRSAGVKCMQSPIVCPLFRMLWLVSMTPFGKPVVPEVYCMLISSWQPTCAFASLSIASSVSDPSVISSEVLYMPRCFSCPMYTTLRSSGKRSLCRWPRGNVFSSGTRSYSICT